MGKRISLNLIDLAGCATRVSDIVVVPISIEADDKKCEVVFSVYETKQGKEMNRRVTRQGRYEKDLFTTSISNVNFRINVTTGIIKKIRPVEV